MNRFVFELPVWKEYFHTECEGRATKKRPFHFSGHGWFFPTLALRMNASPVHEVCAEPICRATAEALYLSLSAEFMSCLFVKRDTNFKTYSLKDNKWQSVGITWASQVIAALPSQRHSAGICKSAWNRPTDILKYIQNQSWYSFNSSMSRWDSRLLSPLCRRSHTEIRAVVKVPKKLCMLLLLPDTLNEWSRLYCCACVWLVTNSRRSWFRSSSA